MPHKLVIYFDQNFISNLAKAQAELHTDKGLQREYKKLYEELLKLVLADKIICPGSQFYHLEGVQDSRLLESLRRVATHLGFGLWFDDFQEVIIRQAKIALHAYVSANAPNYSSRAVAFGKDPALPVSKLGRMVPGRGLQPTWGPLWEPDDEGAQRLRQTKEEFASHLNSAHQRASGTSRRSSELLDAEKRSFIHVFFKVALGQVLDWLLKGLKGALNIREALNLDPRASSVFGLYQEFERLVGSPGDLTCLDKFETFLDSDLLRNIPFVDVYTSIVAEARYRKRQIKPSDLFDWGIGALVIPYVDVFVTDSALADAIRRSKITSRYKVAVLTDTPKGRQELRKLLASLG